MCMGRGLTGLWSNPASLGGGGGWAPPCRTSTRPWLAPRASFPELIHGRLSAIVNSMSATRGKKLWARLGVGVGIWTGLAIALTGQAFLVVYTSIQAHDDIAHLRPILALSELFLSVLAECLIWAVLTLFIFWLARRYPFGQGKWLRSLA